MKKSNRYSDLQESQSDKDDHNACSERHDPQIRRVHEKDHQVPMQTYGAYV